MKLQLIVRTDAEKDIESAFNWYEDQEIDLGKEFVFEVESKMKFLRDHPHSRQIVYNRTRRLVLNRFPYSIFYHVVDDEVVITACVHDKLDPQTWQSRR